MTKKILDKIRLLTIVATALCAESIICVYSLIGVALVLTIIIDSHV